MPHPRGTLLTLALALLVPAGARAQSTRWERQAQERMDHATKALGVVGRADARLSTGGPLNSGESESHSVVLEAGVSYAIVGTCDHDCDRLGLVLAREGNDVTGDRGGGSVPIVRYTPPATMRIDVKVRMIECRVSPCWYQVIVFQLP